MKISIGTAQFGFNYGITNFNGKVKFNEIQKIIRFCNTNKIKNLDTAIEYGKSEQVLGKFPLSKFSIVTKLPKIPNYAIKSPENWIKNQVKKSRQKLKVQKIFCLLLHDPSQLRGKLGNKIIHSIQKLKNEGYLINFGVSVYTVKELNKIISKFKIDLVNLPLSIINRDFMKEDYLKLLKKKKIKIHVRSIFLQGLLLNYKHIKNSPIKKNNFFNQWDKWLNNQNITALEACLLFVKRIKEIDKIIVGVDSVQHLKEICKAYKSSKKIYFPKFIINKKLKNPIKWKV